MTYKVLNINESCCSCDVELIVSGVVVADCYKFFGAPRLCICDDCLKGIQKRLKEGGHKLQRLKTGKKITIRRNIVAEIKKGNGGVSPMAENIYDAYQGLGIAEDETDREKIEEALVSGGGEVAKFRGTLQIGDSSWPVEGKLKRVGGE